jgi:hypothetical protein
LNGRLVLRWVTTWESLLLYVLSFLLLLNRRPSPSNVLETYFCQFLSSSVYVQAQVSCCTPHPSLTNTAAHMGMMKRHIEIAMIGKKKTCMLRMNHHPYWTIRSVDNHTHTRESSRLQEKPCISIRSLTSVKIDIAVLNRVNLKPQPEDKHYARPSTRKQPNLIL